MTENEILQTLTTIFSDIFDLPTINLTDETTADAIPGWDSVSHVTLVVETERVFGIKFRTAEIEDLKNIGDFIGIISQKLNN